MPSTRCDRLAGITRDDVTVVKELHRSREKSVVFQVTVRGLPCIMKVYHYIKQMYYHNRHRVIDTFTNESTAYQRLKNRGLCDRGMVPDYYGVIEQMNPTLWEPYLDMFRQDETRPSAVLIEYIPDLRMIDLDTFTKDRMAKLRAILDEIHKIRIQHGDAEPRNMMVQESSDRVLWIDFECAQTLPEEKPLNEIQQRWANKERRYIRWFAGALEEDYKERKLSRTWTCYFHYM